MGIRCQWGIRNALFYVAKDSSSDEPDRVLGIAMWLPPRPAELKETWGEWLEGWRLWTNQVGMNLRYGRGGLNVKVSGRKWSCLLSSEMQRQPVCAAVLEFERNEVL